MPTKLNIGARCQCLADVPIHLSYFGVVLGLAGLGQAWRIAARLWHLPPAVGEALVAIAGLASQSA